MYQALPWPTISQNQASLDFFTDINKVYFYLIIISSTFCVILYKHRMDELGNCGQLTLCVFVCLLFSLATI